MARNTFSRSLHDVGLSAWFGGTLGNAVALNPASSEARTAGGTGAVANAGWGPVDSRLTRRQSACTSPAAWVSSWGTRAGPVDSRGSPRWHW